MDIYKLVVLHRKLDCLFDRSCSHFGSILEMRNSAYAVSAHFQSFLNQFLSALVGVHSLLRKCNYLYIRIILYLLAEFEHCFQSRKLRVGNVNVSTDILRSAKELFKKSLFRALLDHLWSKSTL